MSASVDAFLEYITSIILSPGANSTHSAPSRGSIAPDLPLPPTCFEFAVAKVLFSSANPDYTRQTQFSFLAKPFSPEDLRIAIAQAFEGPARTVAYAEAEEAPPALCRLRAGQYQRHYGQQFDSDDLHRLLMVRPLAWRWAALYAFDFGDATEDCMEVLTVDLVNQTFDAIVTRTTRHARSARASGRHRF